MDDKRIIAITREIVSKITDCIKQNQPKEQLDNGEAAVILMAIMSDLASNTILNLGATYALIHHESVREEVNGFKEAFFKSVTASLDAADLTRAQTVIAVNMIKTVSDMKKAEELEKSLKMGDNNNQKARTPGPWGYPYTTETKQ